MTESYVGIVSHLGLEQLCLLEHEHTLRFVLRRVQRIKSRPAGCVWAVLDPAFAEQVMILIRLGRPLDALLLLQAVAFDLGPAYPEAQETVFDAG